MDLLKLLSTNEIIAQIISFIVLLVVLRIFVWKKLLKLLDDRRARITDEFKNIDRMRAETENIRSDYEKKIDAIDLIATARIEKAIAEGKRIAEEVRRGAEKDAQAMVDNARETIRSEVVKAKEELKVQIIDLTIAATEKVIQEKLTEADDRKLIGDFLNGMDKMK